jgi:hypothetical protein
LRFLEVPLRNKLTGDPDLWTFGFQDFLYEAGQGETGTLASAMKALSVSSHLS